MKAILKSDRKVIVDVIPYMTNKTFIDTKTGRIYDEDELEFVEYYGG